MAFAVSQLAKGLTYIGKPVHATLFPYPIATTVHATRISIAYQVNARSASATTGQQLSWPAYIAGYLVMVWGGTIITHHLLQLPPPQLYSPTPYIIYINTHLFLTLLFTLFPTFLSPPFLAFLDTVLVPLDALVRTGAITATTAHLSHRASVTTSFHPSVVTYLIIGALASSGGGLTASTLSTWSPTWSFSTPPVLRAPTLIAFFWASVDIWGGALVAAVHATLSGAPAFHGVQELVRPWVGGFLGGAVGLRNIATGGCIVGQPWMSDLEAKALAAGVLSVCFALRVYKVHWAGKKPRPAAKKDVRDKGETQ